MSNYTITRKVHLRTVEHGERQFRHGPSPKPLPTGRVPRISKLMALAIHYDGLLQTGIVEDLASLARLGEVTRARLTQIMDLTLLAPDIQEDLLFLPPTESGYDPVNHRTMREIALAPDWDDQRHRWATVKNEKEIVPDQG